MLLKINLPFFLKTPVSHAPGWAGLGCAMMRTVDRNHTGYRGRHRALFGYFQLLIVGKYSKVGSRATILIEQQRSGQLKGQASSDRIFCSPPRNSRKMYVR